MHPIVLLPPALPQTVLSPAGSFGPTPGIGQKVLLVTESAATEWALGWTHLGSALVGGGGVGFGTGGQTLVPSVPLTGPMPLMPVSATLVPASIIPSACWSCPPPAAPERARK